MYLLTVSLSVIWGVGKILPIIPPTPAAPWGTWREGGTEPPRDLPRAPSLITGGGRVPAPVTVLLLINTIERGRPAAPPPGHCGWGRGGAWAGSSSPWSWWVVWGRGLGWEVRPQLTVGGAWTGSSSPW